MKVSLHKNHPLSKVGVTNAKVAIFFTHEEKPGDVIYNFPKGRVIQRGIKLIKEGSLPKHLPEPLFLKESIRMRHSAKQGG